MPPNKNLTIHDDEFLRIVPEHMHGKLTQIPPDAWTLDDNDYIEKHHVDNITAVLRYSFWTEYNRAIEECRPMMDVNVYAGICAKSTYYQRVKSPRLLGYMIRPPKNYIKSLEEIMDLGLAKLRQIMLAPVISSKGTLNVGAAKIQLMAFQMIDQRLKGAVAMKHEILQKNLNVNVGMPTDAVSLHEKAQNMNLLDSKIKSLEAKLKGSEPKSVQIGAIELEATKVESK